MLNWKAQSEAKPAAMIAQKKDAAGPGWSYVQKTIGDDTYLVMAQSQVELEDEFSSLYYTAQNQSNIFLMPPYEPLALMNLVQANNILNQCIQAMEVNCDGTGVDFEAAQGADTVDEQEKAEAIAFFSEPYPQTSFVSIRRKLRRQVETIGYSFLEVLRNMVGDVVGFRNIETHNVRMVKLDMPVMVTKTMQRGGEDVEFQMWVRERRFAQRVALKTLVYYKEFGATRDVDRNTGKWSTEDTPILPENRGTELLMFGLTPDITTPYYLPRWINQMPSVVGSRKAEEQNLQFLDSGGMPPAMIFIQGGTLAKDTADQIKMYLSGQNKNKQRAIVVEAQSSSGSMDAAGNVQVKVERFGAAQSMDSMWGKYDALTEEHVRVGFRLPTLFIGKPADYNFASSVTAYMVAEAQVFQPERDTFDALMNMTLIKELGWRTLQMKSNPVCLKDPDNQMNLLGVAKDLADRQSMLDEINHLTGFDLKLAPQPQPDTVSGTYGAVNPDGSPLQRGSVQTPAFQQGPPQAALPATTGTQGNQGPKAKKALDIIDLAQDYVVSRGLVRKRELSPERLSILRGDIDGLTPEDFEAFNSLVAHYTTGTSSRGIVRLSKRVEDVCNQLQ
jgi:PBSX family phage portal protein